MAIVVYGTFGDFGMVIGPLVMGWIIDQAGIAAGLLATTGIIGVILFGSQAKTQGPTGRYVSAVAGQQRTDSSLTLKPVWPAAPYETVWCTNGVQKIYHKKRTAVATQTIPISQATKEEFKTGEVTTIVGGHFVNDTFSAFLAPLLPSLITKLSLSLTMAGSLQLFTQLPALLNPFIGYAADKVSLRYFIILAPASTATVMSLLGIAPNYAILAIMLFVAGVSVACFHAPAPAMISRISGNQIGKGMSLFMAGGELGRTIGPLLVAWAVSSWTLEGMYPVMVLGWIASLILYWRLRKIPARTEKPQNIRAVLPTIRRVFVPIVIILFARSFMLTPMQVYLPTYLNLEGASLLGASFSLTIWELAGVGGALLGGTLSDRLGRKKILFFALITAPFMTMVFLKTSGWLLIPVLLLHGLIALSTNPVLMAIVQEHMPQNRAVGNGIFISLAFLIRPVAAISLGFMGDTLGLDTAFWWGALFSFVSIPAVFFLPQLEHQT